VTEHVGTPDKHKKKPISEYLATYTWICSRMKKNFMAFFRMNIDQFYHSCPELPISISISSGSVSATSVAVAVSGTFP